jgi:hypothetical protein
MRASQGVADPRAQTFNTRRFGIAKQTDAPSMKIDQSFFMDAAEELQSRRKREKQGAHLSASARAVYLFIAWGARR